MPLGLLLGLLGAGLAAGVIFLARPKKKVIAEEVILPIEVLPGPGGEEPVIIFSTPSRSQADILVEALVSEGVTVFPGLKRVIFEDRTEEFQVILSFPFVSEGTAVLDSLRAKGVLK